LKLSLEKCKSYDYDLVKAAIEKSFVNMGGKGLFFNPGERVLLKVNLLMKKTPEEATTTHPVFVKALANSLVEYGCSVLIGDSPGGPYNEKSLKRIYEGCGYNEIISDLIKLNYNVEGFNKPFSEGHLLKNITLIDALNDVDKVVSVSKFKTHGMMKFTGAVKNLFGTIPGIIKAEYHFKMPNTDDFGNMLIDVCECVNPVVSFMDGIVGMEGAGPSAGNPRDVGLVIASENPHLLDLGAVKIANIDPEEVPTLDGAFKRNLISRNLMDYQIVGEDIDKLVIEDFDAPEIRSVDFLGQGVPKFLKGVLGPLLTPKPVFHDDLCIGCGECQRLCPPDAITMINKKPIVDLDKCIRCYCCQELCPKKAVSIHRPWLLKKMTKL
jgi:uncharacterized protein (DUF362 family)/Pyruvate/2-oxoacid:ferredoxin oxidoreductase delta subunit